MRKVISAGGIVLRKAKNGFEMLLFYSSYYNSWLIPKGHVEREETIEEAAIREVREETGLADFQTVSMIGVITRKGQEHSGEIVEKNIHVFVFRTDARTTPTPTEKWHEKTGWFSIDDGIKSLFFDEDREFLLKHKSELNFK